MKYILSVHAYDCLSQVNYSAQIREYADYESDSSEVVLIQVGTFPGEGLSNPRDWLQDVLVAMLERL